MIKKPENLKKIVGLIKEDKKDVARNHDKYLAEAISKKPRKGIRTVLCRVNIP